MTIGSLDLDDPSCSSQNLAIYDINHINTLECGSNFSSLLQLKYVGVSLDDKSTCSNILDNYNAADKYFYSNCYY
jgi:hypothetical protein